MIDMSYLREHEGTMVTVTPGCLGTCRPTPLMEVKPMVIGIILIVTSCFIISINLLVTAALLRLLLRKSSQSWCFVLNLALADTLVGVAITGLATEDLSTNRHFLQHFATTHPPTDATPQGKTRCLMRMAFVISPCTASIMSLFLISLDRYVAIKMPLRYFQFSGKGTMAGFLLSLWIAAFTMGFLPVMVRQMQTDSYDGFCALFSVVHKFTMIIFILCFFPVLSIFIYIYLDILRIACSHQRQISRVRHAGSRMANQCGRQDTEHQHQHQHQQHHQLRSSFHSHAKALRMVAALIGCFLVLWSPFFVVCIVQLICEKCQLTVVLENHLWILGLCNSLINPLVYAFWQREVRLQLVAMFYCLMCRSSTTRTTSVAERNHPTNVPAQHSAP